MRILHLNDRLSERGGADIHLLGVLENLATEHDVLLGVGHDDGSATTPVQLVRVPDLGSSRATRLSADLERLRTTFAPDIIHVHNIMNPEALGWAADRGAVMTVQDHRTFCPGRGKLTLGGDTCREPMSAQRCAACFEDEEYGGRIQALTAERLAQVQRMAAVTVLSPYMRDELIAAGVDADRIEVIPPFVHGFDSAPEPAGPTCILFVGRLVATKGVDDAIEAWRRSGNDLPLIFAGSGPERNRLEAAGHTVLGWTSHAGLGAVFRRAAVLLMPSLWQEPFGIAGLEALTLGVPVVAYDSGGIRSWHPGPGLVPKGDVAALATALSAVLSAPPPIPRLSGFDRRELMAALVSLYDRTKKSRT